MQSMLFTPKPAGSVISVNSIYDLFKTEAIVLKANCCSAEDNLIASIILFYYFNGTEIPMQNFL